MNTARLLLLLGLVTGVAVAQEEKPQRRRPRRQKLVIPEVTRDQVICFALYTVQNQTLKMTAVLYPLRKGEPRRVRLEVMKEGTWTTVSETEVVERGWTAHFRVGNWDASREWNYRVAHSTGAFYTGIVRSDPVDKEEIVVAAFTGNSNADRGPKPDIIANIKAHDPDILFFSGDQVYDHGKHYAAWLLFGRQFGDIIRNRPTITIPDDHDVGQGNIWGAGGVKRAKTGAGADGGYFHDPEFVKEVERGQTWHLPDPVDPKPLPIGIGVYFTKMTWGRISFAILEDRKFKTGPQGTIPKQGPRPDHINNPAYDPKTVDVPGLKLLGDRQLKFLGEWATDWKGADMKAVLSQTIFANAAHIHGKLGGRLLADLDSNGWPQTGRNKAVDAIRKAFAVHICGDQHLATLVQHGIDDWNDGHWSFCVPSIWNYYNRWWWPLGPGKNRQPNSQEMTGEFRDGLHNKITMHAYANPTPTNNRASGHGIVRFNKKSRKITMECWPRFTDVTAANAKQFDGWPRVIHQEDNYGRKAVAALPNIRVSGATNPVITVIDESDNSLVTSIRINGTEWRPKVFRKGAYTVEVRAGDAVRKITGMKPGGGTFEVTFKR